METFNTRFVIDTMAKTTIGSALEKSGYNYCMTGFPVIEGVDKPHHRVTIGVGEGEYRELNEARRHAARKGKIEIFVEWLPSHWRIDEARTHSWGTLVRIHWWSE